jgi:cytochrome b
MSPAPAPAAGKARIKVWDAPTRLTHWLLAAAFLFGWWTVEAPDNWWEKAAPLGVLGPLGAAAHWWGEDISRLQWHRWTGYLIIGLVIFRLYWGLAGSETARFSSFLKGPAATARYFKGLFGKTGPISLGHNPMGGWSVMALLAAVAAIVGLGLFAVDVDAFEGGPLSGKVSFDMGRQIAHWHELAFNIALGLIVLHIAAIAFYALVKRENLIRAMVTGSKPRPAGAGDLAFAPAWRLAVGVVLAAGLAWFIAKGLHI